MFGEEIGGLGGEVVFPAEEGGDPGQSVRTFEAQNTADAGAKYFGFIGGQLGAEAQQKGRALCADLFDCAGGVYTYGHLLVAKQRGQVAEYIGGREITALHERKGAGPAERAGGVGGASPDGFQLNVSQPREKGSRGLILEGGEGAREFLFRPALGIGFDGVAGRGQETVESCGEVVG